MMSRVLVMSSLARSGFILKNILNRNFYSRKVWEAGVTPNLQTALRCFSEHSGMNVEDPNRRTWSWNQQMEDPRFMNNYEDMVHSGAMMRQGQPPGQNGKPQKCEFTIDREIKFCIPLKMKGEIDVKNNGECKP